jgi:hypothetical protein
MAASGGIVPGGPSGAADDNHDDRIRAAIAKGRTLIEKRQFDEAGRVIRDVGSLKRLLHYGPTG